MKYLVFGLGISGKAAAEYLLSKNESVIGVDRKVKKVPGLKIYDEDVSLEGIDCLIVSPGIPPSHPLVREAGIRKIEVISEAAFALKQIQNRCIGITGSNGKTTTTLLINHVLNLSGIPARAVGNVGVGLSTVLMDGNPDEILVIELSSFQLELLNIPCLDFALLLNISENHLDRYFSMQEYVRAKVSIQNCLKEHGILFASKELVREYGINARVYENAALAICQQFGITEERFHRSALSFEKPPHRLEKVDVRHGVTIYNDSKSTNVASTMYAVRELSGAIVLIVGGSDKGSSYAPWVNCFKGKVKHIIAYGSAREKIEQEIGSMCRLTKVSLFEDAVKMALNLSQKGDTVLLSPGCSSYDQFDNFERRGDMFKELVLEGKWIAKKQF